MTNQTKGLVVGHFSFLYFKSLSVRRTLCTKSSNDIKILCSTLLQQLLQFEIIEVPILLATKKNR